jgi:beta-lactamase regulating signal transducer with metallopeptidase domain
VTAVQHALSVAILHFLWQASLLAMAVRAVLPLLSKCSPNLRYSICCTALAGMLALPVITTLVVMEESPHAPPALDLSPDTLFPMPRVLPDPQAAPSRTDLYGRIDIWTMRIWCIGVVLASLRLRLGLNGVARLRESGQPAGPALRRTLEKLMDRMGVTQRVELLVSTVTSGPGMAGIFRPVIFLPAAALANLPPEYLEAVLAHEIAHIRRHDYLVNLFQIAAETLLFYHPAVWWLSARIREEREYCCDDAAVRSCQNVAGYARALTALEKLRLSAPAPALGGTDGPLLRRIQRLLGEPRATASGQTSGILVLLLGLTCVAVGARVTQGVANRDGFESGAISSAVLTVARDANVVSHVPIPYPSASLAAGSHGCVVIRLIIDSSGAVRDAYATPPSSSRFDWAPPDLQKSALESIAKWHFLTRKTAGYASVVVLFQANPRSADGFMEAGDLLFGSGLVDAALPRYRAGAEAFPLRRLEFLKRQVDVYRYQNNLPAARRKVGEILNGNPKDLDARALRASFQLDEGASIDGATSELQYLVTARPQNVMSRFDLARAYSLRHDPARAISEFANVAARWPGTPWALLAQSEIAFLNGDYEQAIREAERAGASPPFHSLALNLEANAQRAREQSRR